MRKVIEERKAEELEANSCQICLMPFEGEPIPLENCSHIFCYECLKGHVKAKIDGNQFPIPCPSCNVRIHDINVKMALGDRAEIIKYEERQLKFFIDTNQHMSWCPTPDCKNVFEFNEGDPPRFACNSCFKTYCLNCRADWHNGMTCQEYRINNAHLKEDDQFLSFVRGS